MKVYVNGKKLNPGPIPKGPYCAKERFSPCVPGTAQDVFTINIVTLIEQAVRKIESAVSFAVCRKCSQFYFNELDDIIYAFKSGQPVPQAVKEFLAELYAKTRCPQKDLAAVQEICTDMINTLRASRVVT